MNAREQNVYDALVRSAAFAALHAGKFPTSSQAVAGFGRLPGLISTIGHCDSQSGYPASPGTVAKAELFAEMWQTLKAISETAKRIGKKEPGFAKDYPLSTDDHEDILATAASFIRHLKTPGTEAKFVAYDFSDGFTADLESDLAVINGKTTVQADDKIESTGDTARVRFLIQEARELLRDLDVSVRNRFRNDAEILAEWRTAARVHQTPKAAKSDEVQPPSPEQA